VTIIEKDAALCFSTSSALSVWRPDSQSGVMATVSLKLPLPSVSISVALAVSSRGMKVSRVRLTFVWELKCCPLSIKVPPTAIVRGLTCKASLSEGLLTPLPWVLAVSETPVKIRVSKISRHTQIKAVEGIRERIRLQVFHIGGRDLAGRGGRR